MATDHDVPFTIIRGGGRTFVKPVIEDIQYLSAETHTIPVAVTDVITKSGVPLNVDVIAQIKVRTDTPGLIAAAEQLLGKTEGEIKNIAKENLEGQIRSACARLEVETINNDRDKLASLVQKEAVPDLAKLGLELTTFTVKDIADKNGYLKALGEEKTAQVLRDAQIGKARAEAEAQKAVAEAKRDQEAATAKAIEADLAIAKAEAARAGQVEEAKNAATVAEANKERDVRVEAARQATQKAKADADVAYGVQEAKAKQSLAEQQKILNAKEADARAELERMNTVVPAEARAQAVAAAAEGNKQEALRRAEAEAEGIRIKGQAEAEAIKLKLMAEAEGLQAQADAYANFNDAALADRLATYTPEIAQHIASAFAGVEKVVILNGGAAGGADPFTDMLTQATASVPELMKSLTGKSITDLVQGFKALPSE